MDTEDEWGRLAALPEAGNRAGVYTTGGDLRAHGIDPLTLGLVDLGAAIRRGDDQLEIPFLSNIALSVIVPGEVQLITAKANSFRRDHPVIGAGVFTDDHPADWLETLATFDQSVLVYAPHGPHHYSSYGKWLKHWHIGLLPVAYRVDFDDFSMFPPGTTITVNLDDGA
ncbi:hypothetical protein QN345_01670 [Cryobacterium sp. 10I1]|uniref:hypothetical protein n=1 Tax=unclassified Cryobacterium TaxID=2649013 RepID=UPI002AB5AF44|nr:MULTISPECIES: hypothetical protein [unclassified Cryobacterium]MDY7544567.1 hypothetical protein [Cryobacterium sp. 5B3]MEB0000116.1 hypothetical protein [Cryobacterium sp. RTS3]MEB0202490.1 hypothetical protein [Cryobacterium sp. 5I3]MEB0267417.1 hypothetical protein [Cryobacterium sp. 10I5]MEB0275130.1 hypothetical protein [Cryobacterium sp. 5B3]